MAFAQTWSESDPDGSVITVSQLDDEIRNLKVAIRERLEGDPADAKTGVFGTGTFAAAPKIKTLYKLNGAVGTPSNTYDSDTDLGEYRVGANEVGWTANGVRQGGYGVNGLIADDIVEMTAAAGVTIDSVLLKDGGATLTGALSVNADLGHIIRRDRAAAGAALTLSNLDATAATNHSVILSTQMSTTAPATVTAGGLEIHKQQEWTSTTSTQDAKMLLRLAQDGSVVDVAEFLGSDKSATFKGAVQIDGALTVTGAQAVAETEVTPGALLARVADNETISGVWGFTGQAAASATKTGTQTVLNVTTTIVEFNGTDDYDVSGMHDPVTNNGRMTVQSGQGGKYILSAVVDWDNTWGAGDIIEAVIRKNNSTARFAHQRVLVSGTIAGWRMNLNAQDDAVATDYYTVEVNQSSGGSATLGADCRFQAIRVH